MFRLFIVLTIMVQTATLSLFQNGILGELTKWEALMEHYHEHCVSKHHEDFMEFLFAHYWGHESQDSDHKDFPCEHFHVSGIVLIQPCCPFRFGWLKNDESDLTHPTPAHTPLLDRYESNGIWHPPSA